MKIDARLPQEKTRFDNETETHLVVSLTAPPLTADVVRPKLALTVCVDTSSSMMGQKIEYAKRSILKLIDHLKPDDHLGIVAFATDASTIAPLTRLMEGKKDEMRKLVNNLRASGNTNFAGGMLSAIDMLKNADLGASYIHRLIMFTDGEANTGPATQTADIIRFFKANAPDYITASAFGYGKGVHDFNAAFLTEFAREAKGNYAHVEDPDNALKAFGTELGGLISTYATNIHVTVTPLAGHTISRVVSDVDADEEVTGDLHIKVPDILAEETRHIVLAVKLAAQKANGPRAVNVFSVKSSYDTFDVTGKKETKLTEAKAKVQFVKDADEQKPSTEIAEIIGLAQLVRAQLDAEEKAKAGDFVGANATMDQMAKAFEANGNARLAAMSNSISGRIGSAHAYASNQGYLRGFAGGATRGMGGASYSLEVQNDLDALGVQTSNSTQTSTASSFVGSTPAPVVQPASQVVGYVPPGPLTGDSINFGPGVIGAGGLGIGGPMGVGIGGPISIGSDSIPLSIGPAEAVAILGTLSVQPTQAPAPTHETDSDPKSDKDKGSKPARKRVKQTRSNKNW